MSKFLRKHKHWILVVGGCLLMVAWLFPQAMHQFGSVGLTSTIAHYKGGRLTGKDYQDAQQELKSLSEISPLLLMALGLYDGRGLTSSAVDHWLLLSKEAEMGGWVGGAADGVAMLDDLAVQVQAFQARQGVFGSKPPELSAVRQQLELGRHRAMAGHTEKWADHLLAKAAGTVRMMGAARSLGISFSGKESAFFAWELFDAAVADLVLVPASAVASELTPPDDARIAAHFEKYKEVRPGTGEMGIGYLREPAVKVEWITVARQAVIDSMPADAIDVNKYWRQNKAQFGENYSEVKAAVETEFKRQHGEKLLEKAREAVARQVLKASAGVETHGKYKKLPEDWASKMPTMESLAEAARTALDLPAAAGMVIANPTDHRYRTMAELRELPGIGTATGRINDAQFISFAQAAVEVRELGSDSLHATQVGVLYGPVRDALAQNDYYFRVLEARPASAPDSVADVIDKVKSDIADMDGYEVLKQQADAYRQRLAAKGVGDMTAIPGVRTALDAVVRREYMTGSSPNQQVSIREADTPEVREAVMTVAEKWDPKADVSAIPTMDRTVAVPVPSARALVLGLAKARRPLTVEKLAESDNQVVGYARQRVLGAASGVDPYSFEAVKARMQFEPVRKSGGENGNEAKAAASTGG